VETTFQRLLVHGQLLGVGASFIVVITAEPLKACFINSVEGTVLAQSSGQNDCVYAREKIVERRHEIENTDDLGFRL
jgi:hypothetical protein